MIVDCHTHIWETPEQLGIGGGGHPRRQGKAGLPAKPEDHLAASACVDKVFVLGFASRFLGEGVPNRVVGEYIKRNNDKMIGFTGIDPLADGTMDELQAAAANPAFRGITLSPAGQDFHPSHSGLGRVYEFCIAHKLAVMVHQGTHYWCGAKMEYARAYLWDQVLRDFPALRVIIAHLGSPWVEETLTLLGKHANAYADIAGLTRSPWHAYNSLVLAHQLGVTDKLLFGSDFPFLTASEAIESLYRINEVSHGTNLPSVPREVLRGVIERDTLAALGMERPGDRQPAKPATEEEEELA